LSTFGTKRSQLASQAVARQIDEYNQSSSDESFEQVSEKAEMLAEKGKEKLTEIEKLQPELDRESEVNGNEM
jgi:phage shock protein A